MVLPLRLCPTFIKINMETFLQNNVGEPLCGQPGSMRFLVSIGASFKHLSVFPQSTVVEKYELVTS